MTQRSTAPFHTAGHKAPTLTRKRRTQPFVAKSFVPWSLILATFFGTFPSPALFWIPASQASEQEIRFFKSYRELTAKGLVRIKEVPFKDFQRCQHVVYRQSMQERLPFEYQQKLLLAAEKGKIINQVQTVRSLMRSFPGYCSYGSPGELADLPSPPSQDDPEHK